MSSSFDINEQLDMLVALRIQEDSTYVPKKWISIQQSEIEARPRFAKRRREVVNEECREKMANWCFEVADFCDMNYDTVEIAMSMIDRFLCLGKGRASRINRSCFRLTCMAAFYTAVKIHERTLMEPRLFEKLSQGLHSSEDIVEMEGMILNALKWRVNPPTTTVFLSLLLNLIPDEFLDEKKRRDAYDLSLMQTRFAVSKYRFVAVKASTLAYCAILNSLENLHIDDYTFALIVDRLSEALHIDRFSVDIIDIQRALFEVLPEHVIENVPAQKYDEAGSPMHTRKTITLEISSPRSVMNTF